MIELEPFAKEDIARLAGWVRTPEELFQWAGRFFRHPLTEESLTRYLESADDPIAPRRIFKAVNTDDGTVVGHIELSHIWPGLSGRMSRVLVGKPGSRGKGLGTQMVTRFVDLAFGDYAFHRIDVGVTEDNAAAIACYRKAGFDPVGTWRDAMDTPDGKVTVLWLSRFR